MDNSMPSGNRKAITKSHMQILLAPATFARKYARFPECLKTTWMKSRSRNTRAGFAHKTSKLQAQA
eukprot:1656400-Amphidinium_carterae.1